MTKLEAKLTTMWIGQCPEELFDGAVHPPMEYVMHQNEAQAQTEMDNRRQTQFVEPPLILYVP